MDGLLLQIDFELLPTWTGVLSDIYIPARHKTTKELYKILASDVLVGGDNALFPFTAVGGAVETISGLHGKTVIAVFRGTSFEPGATWNPSTDELTAPVSNAWLGGEPLNLLYKL